MTHLVIALLDAGAMDAWPLSAQAAHPQLPQSAALRDIPTGRIGPQNRSAWQRRNESTLDAVGLPIQYAFPFALKSFYHLH